jgi:hypothetical protein
LGDFVGRTIEAREQAELAFHDLERSLAIRTGDSTAAEEDVTRDVDLLLGEILVHSGRILLKLVPENPLHIEAARVVASARHARMRIAEVGARRAIHLMHG